MNEKRVFVLAILYCIIILILIFFLEKSPLLTSLYFTFPNRMQKKIAAEPYVKWMSDFV